MAADTHLSLSAWHRCRRPDPGRCLVAAPGQRCMAFPVGQIEEAGNGQKDKPIHAPRDEGSRDRAAGHTDACTQGHKFTKDKHQWRTRGRQNTQRKHARRASTQNLTGNPYNKRNRQCTVMRTRGPVLLHWGGLLHTALVVPSTARLS